MFNHFDVPTKLTSSVQGHSRSPILVPIESLYATSNYILSGIISKVSQIVVHKIGTINGHFCVLSPLERLRGNVRCSGLLMRPEHSETKAKTETRECETEIETETKKLL